MSDRKPRGRIDPDPRGTEPVWLPEPPKKLVFGTHTICPSCKGKGKKGGMACRTCRGTTVVIDESTHRDDHQTPVAGEHG